MENNNLPYDLIFGRTTLIAGPEMMETLRHTRVIIFGLGGVGSWCAEALVRSGIGHITLVDSDDVAASNINRQLPATTRTVGRPKVEVLRERFLEINPECDITAIRGIYSEDTAAGFDIPSYDYAIDAIDSLANKAHLILWCTNRATAPRRGFYSSMGAALKVSGTAISVAPFDKVAGCPLARALRTYFKRRNLWPRRKFLCVFSPERLSNRAEPAGPADPSDTWSPRKVAINGTFAHTTAIFGLQLAGLLIEDIYRKA